MVRSNFDSTRQWIADGRWPLRRSRLLLTSRSLQERNDEANDCAGRFIQRMSPNHPSKNQLIHWHFNGHHGINFFLSISSVSTIAISHRSIWTASLIPGGTTGTELPCISGRGAIPASTPVSAESTTIAPNPLWLATAILPHPFY